MGKNGPKNTIDSIYNYIGIRFLANQAEIFYGNSRHNHQKAVRGKNLDV